jgi:hypothetical protein
MGNEKQTHRHKDTKLGLGGPHVPGEICERLPKPECLFYRSVQGNESGEIYVSNSLDLRLKELGLVGYFLHAC